eukprot:CAMPEP_0176357028 /NCGR_PEP_ID=MMETSP0126-20121128/14467_1 /TAXON_ID=141414 ORGANISM="Strombidinopsis acuminatum, Strain SPMC142" /NCGR_SAMPLE_ID=MMETSP0126 /ASSEMBLY_ACC=CAM_ASM_000229 /LENGTH=141 /DNA_ID=CAMNT_0017710433 /DNA_START=131 /DNA_END=556 /DNA_ORIENTATION=+
MIRNYRRGAVNKDLTSASSHYINKSIITIQYLYKELLSDKYWEMEYTKISELFEFNIPARALDQDKLNGLELLIQRIRDLLKLRVDITSFLVLLHKREKALKNMKEAVEQIEHETFCYAEEATEIDKSVNPKLAKDIEKAN